MWYYVISAVLFVLSQLDFFLLSKVICNVSIDAFLITIKFGIGLVLLEREGHSVDLVPCLMFMTRPVLGHIMLGFEENILIYGPH